MTDQSSIDYWYQVLGLGTDATEQDVKSTYRRLAKQFHPDHNSVDESATEKFIKIKHACDFVLEHIRQRSETPPDDQSSNPNSASRGRVRVSVHRSNQSSEPVKNQTSSAASKSNPEPSTSPSYFEARQLKLDLIQKLQNWLADAKWNRVIQEVGRLGTSLRADPEIRSIKAKAYHGLAKEYASSGKYEQAHSYVRKALETDSRHQEFWQAIEQQYRGMVQQQSSRSETEQEEFSQTKRQYSRPAEPEPKRSSAKGTVDRDSKTGSPNARKEIVRNAIDSVVPQAIKTWMQTCWTNHRLETLVLLASLGLLGSVLIHQALSNRLSNPAHQNSRVSLIQNAYFQNPQNYKSVARVSKLAASNVDLSIN